MNALRTLVDLMVEDSQSAPERVPPGALDEDDPNREDDELPPQIGPHLPEAFDMQAGEADSKRTLR
jgi:hypothetical protein